MSDIRKSVPERRDARKDELDLEIKATESTAFVRTGMVYNKV